MLPAGVKNFTVQAGWIRRTRLQIQMRATALQVRAYITLFLRRKAMAQLQIINIPFNWNTGSTLSTIHTELPAVC